MAFKNRVSIGFMIFFIVVVNALENQDINSTRVHVKREMFDGATYKGNSQVTNVVYKNQLGNQGNIGLDRSDMLDAARNDDNNGKETNVQDQAPQTTTRANKKLSNKPNKFVKPYTHTRPDVQQTTNDSNVQSPSDSVDYILQNIVNRPNAVQHPVYLQQMTNSALYSALISALSRGCGANNNNNNNKNNDNNRGPSMVIDQRAPSPFRNRRMLEDASNDSDDDVTDVAYNNQLAKRDLFENLVMSGNIQNTGIDQRAPNPFTNRGKRNMQLAKRDLFENLVMSGNIQNTAYDQRAPNPFTKRDMFGGAVYKGTNKVSNVAYNNQMSGSQGNTGQINMFGGATYDGDNQISNVAYANQLGYQGRGSSSNGYTNIGLDQRPPSF